jgi:predicted ATPase
MADIGDASVRYRLPETIRAYAAEKLDESGEREPIMPHLRAVSSRPASSLSDLSLGRNILPQI